MKMNTAALRVLNSKLNDQLPFPYVGAEREVGIEIECEGHNLDIPLRYFWEKHQDGSLRGESIEYVLKKPIPRGSTLKALEYLSKNLEDNQSRVDISYRTSVHVHLNSQHMKIRDIINQICLYICFEELLLEFCGNARVGNLFCLRVSDAENFLQSVRRFIRSGALRCITNDDLRYCAINVAALGKYGSLEFRSLRGTTDPQLIQQWISMLLDIRDAAQLYDNPQRICEEMSHLGPVDFICKVFSAENAAILLQQDGISERMFNSVRLAQDIAYCIPSWDMPKPKEVVFDPMEIVERELQDRNFQDLRNRILADLLPPPALRNPPQRIAIDPIAFGAGGINVVGHDLRDFRIDDNAHDDDI